MPISRNNKGNTSKIITSQKRTSTLEGIPILKPVANSTHQRIINRVGTFPCPRCKRYNFIFTVLKIISYLPFRVFDRIKSLNAHMKCHRDSYAHIRSHRESKTSLLKDQINTDC